MKQTNQTTTLPTIDLPRHRFDEYNFVNLGTGHQTSDIGQHPYTQDHVLSCSATKNSKYIHKKEKEKKRKKSVKTMASFASTEAACHTYFSPYISPLNWMKMHANFTASLPGHFILYDSSTVLHAIFVNISLL